jgi:SAM-dependent methyltransferase
MSTFRELASRAKHRVRPRSDLPYLHCVEEPAVGDPPRSHSVLVKGWVEVPDGADVGPFAVDHGRRTPLATVERPDRHHRRGKRVVGFVGLVPVATSSREHPWQLTVAVDGREHARALPVELDDAGHDRFRADKVAKLARIEPLLRCPRPRVASVERASCLGELVADGDDALRCRACGERYGRTESAFDFLSPELRAVGGVDTTHAISDWGYDPIATALIAEFADGLVLDAGSGLKEHSLPNVVNLEIADYPTTDVLAIGERLPFATGSMDAVMSLAVLEHVRDPFRCAAEIARVVRPGGRLYVAVPFLQPYHGYPHHYFNMTRGGLEGLFADDFVIDESGTPSSGLPIFTLTWFLKSYVDGLPPATARRLRSMRVGDLVGDGDDYLDRPFVGELSPAVEEELACTNYLVATKR